MTAGDTGMKRALALYLLGGIGIVIVLLLLDQPLAVGDVPLQSWLLLAFSCNWFRARRAGGHADDG
jgi:hypothetical protein